MLKKWLVRGIASISAASLLVTGALGAGAADGAAAASPELTGLPAAAGQTIAGVSRADPGFTYGPAARDWVETADYYYIENEHVKFTVGTVRLCTKNPTDYSPDASGNDRWGSLTKGSMMDAAPKPSMRDNLDYTEFVLREQLHRTWWYPTEKLEMGDINIAGDTITASGGWDKDASIKSSVVYSIVENTPLIKMELTLTNESGKDFSGYFGYFIDSDEAGEQHSYVPGWGWRTAQANQWITTGWNKNYIFNGVKDKFTGNPAHAVIWPEGNQPAALVPEGYIQGVWFDAAMAAGDSKTLVFYHLPHIAGPAAAPYQMAEFWADVVKKGIDPAEIVHISGTVTDETGQPSSGVELIVTESDNNAYTATTTDAKGFYSLYVQRSKAAALSADNGAHRQERELSGLIAGSAATVDFQLSAPVPREITGGVTKDDPGFTYEGTSRDWWPANDYYYLDSPEIKFTVGTVRTASKDPVDWSNDASGNNKWGSLTPGHMMDAVPKLTMQENLDYTEFVLSDDLGETPQDEANGKYMEWSWFHPLTKLQMPDIHLAQNTIIANGDWDNNAKMKASVRYSIVEGTPLIKMEITLNNQTGTDFDGDFGYIIDPDQPGEQQSYLPGWDWVYSQEKRIIKSGWTDNYLFNGINNAFSGKTAHAIIWPEEQQPSRIMHEGIFMGTWFKADIPNGQQKQFTIYHLPHIAGPADKPYAAAEFWAKFIRDQEDAANYGSISGKVTDEAGNPLAFTDVLCKDTEGNLCGKTVTNSEGNYQMFVRNGHYEIAPDHKAYSVESLQVEVGAVKRVQASFVLKKYAELDVHVPAGLKAGVPFDMTVKVRNVTDEPLEQLKVAVEVPYFVQLLEEGQLDIPQLAAKGEVEFKIKAIPLEGGRSFVKGDVRSGLFQVTKKSSFDVQGAGYYAGDNHSHTKHSDGVHSVAENSDSVYNKRLLSWVWNMDHNTVSQKQDADAVTQSYSEHFLSLTGTEITTSAGHALAYGLGTVPRYDVNNPATEYTWQDSINEVAGQNGLFYIAHPFIPTFAFQTPYVWRNFTGVEVWNGSYHALDNGINERAFKFWDEINIRGDKKYYGITNSDGHTKDKVGDPYIKGRLDSLTEANVLQLLRTGEYYGTNGPELRFSIGGIGMGGTVKLKNAETVPFTIQAYDPNSNLTHIRVLKYSVTGNMDDYKNQEIVFEQDLTGQAAHSFVTELELPVADKEFYRLEVRSERASENSSGIGPLAGTGFAYSNPIWIEEAAASNLSVISNMKYKGKSLTPLKTFGVTTLEIADSVFDPKKLKAKVSSGSNGAIVSGVKYTPFADENQQGNPASRHAAGLVELTVMAKDQSEHTYRYLIRLTGAKGQAGGDGDQDDHFDDQGSGDN